MRHPGGAFEGLTTFGVTIQDILDGARVPDPQYRDHDKWEYECEEIEVPGRGGGQRCHGVGLATCAKSWKSDHQGMQTSQTISGSATIGVDFPMVNVEGQVSGSVTTSYSYGGSKGYLTACSDAGNNMLNQCMSLESQCYSQNHCSDSER